MTTTAIGTPGLTATAGAYQFNRVIAVNPVLNLETAKGMTAKNGYDEVFLQTASGRLYAAVGLGGKLDLRPGYVGTVNGEQARVVHVDDEVNSAGEGAKQPFTTIAKMFGTTGSSAVTTMVTTSVAGMMAGAAVGTTSAIKIGALARSAGGAFVAAFQRLAVSGAVGLGITAVVLGAWSAIGAIRGATRKGDDVTLQMLQ